VVKVVEIYAMILLTIHVLRSSFKLFVPFKF